MNDMPVVKFRRAHKQYKGGTVCYIDSLDEVEALMNKGIVTLYHKRHERRNRMVDDRHVITKD